MINAETIIGILKVSLQNNKFIDADCKHVLGPLGDEAEFQKAILKLKEEGYGLFTLPVINVTTGEDFNIDILGRVGLTIEDLNNYKDQIELPSIVIIKDDGNAE